MKRPELMYKIK